MSTKNRTAEIDHARKIDTEVARRWALFHEVNAKITSEKKQLDRFQKLHALAERNGHEQRAADMIRTIDKAKGRIESLLAEAASLRASAIQYDRDNYRGWNRFFLVRHIHASQHCSSFRPTTRVGWLPDVSGLTEVEAVREHGSTLCTICFPSAPTELTTPKVDPNVCAGSGKRHSTEYLTGREGSHFGASGYCPECLRHQSVTATGKMRKHKPNDETRRHALDARR